MIAARCGGGARALCQSPRSGGEQRRGPVPPVVGVRRSGRPGRIGSTGWVRSRACICDFSSTHKTTARADARPTISRNEQRVLREGLAARANLRPSPHSARTRAIERSSVWRRGASIRVVVTTRSTSASDTVRGVPGRASSSKPPAAPLSDGHPRRAQLAATARSLFRPRRWPHDSPAPGRSSGDTQRSSSSRCMVRLGNRTCVVIGQRRPP